MRVTLRRAASERLPLTTANRWGLRCAGCAEAPKPEADDRDIEEVGRAPVEEILGRTEEGNTVTIHPIFAVATFLLLSAVHATASECIGFSTADLLKSRGAVFVGFVEKSEVAGRDPIYGPVVRVTFSVSDTFVSEVARFSGKRIELHQWAFTGMTDYDNRLEVGREYLVFAGPNDRPGPSPAPKARYTSRACDAWEVQSAAGKERLAELRKLVR